MGEGVKIHQNEARRQESRPGPRVVSRNNAQVTIYGPGGATATVFPVDARERIAANPEWSLTPPEAQEAGSDGGKTGDESGANDAARPGSNAAQDGASGAKSGRKSSGVKKADEGKAGE